MAMQGSVKKHFYRGYQDIFTLKGREAFSGKPMVSCCKVLRQICPSHWLLFFLPTQVLYGLQKLASGHEPNDQESIEANCFHDHGCDHLSLMWSSVALGGH